MVIRRGEVWWAHLDEPIGRRPVVVLSRNEACAVRTAVTVAPVTTTRRGIPAEVPLGRQDGLPRKCVANLDTVQTVLKSRLTRRIATLHPAKLLEVAQAIKFVLALD